MNIQHIESYIQESACCIIIYNHILYNMKSIVHIPFDTMKQELFFDRHADCKICTESTNRGFLYMESCKGEKKTFEITDTFTLVFILKGKALVSCNEFTNVYFKAGEAFLLPVKSSCMWEALTDTECIVLNGSNDVSPCDKQALANHADRWLNVIPDFKALPIKPRMEEFLYSVKNYLNDGITCLQMHRVKEREMSMLLRAYYSPQELFEFFIITVRNTYEFEWFIMNNYLKMKGVKEFVDLSGMNVSTFNRKFKTHFKQSPYQWLIKQKSKHIYHALTATDKSLASISKEFYFSDASHFNRYCKTMFGTSPSELRRQASLDNQKIKKEIIAHSMKPSPQNKNRK